MKKEKENKKNKEEEEELKEFKIIPANQPFKKLPGDEKRKIDWDKKFTPPWMRPKNKKKRTKLKRL